MSCKFSEGVGLGSIGGGRLAVVEGHVMPKFTLTFQCGRSPVASSVLARIESVLHVGEGREYQPETPARAANRLPLSRPRLRFGLRCLASDS